MSCSALKADARYVNRYRTAPTVHPGLQEFASFLHARFEDWATILAASQTQFRDQMATQSAADKKAIIAAIRKTMNLMAETVVQALPQAGTAPKRSIVHGSSLGLIATIQREYDGPGDLSEKGPRHDNDHADIRDISIPSSAQEMVAQRDPYLPANIPGARHHLPDDSMAKIPDIQFRLLRADMTGGLQQGIKAVLEDMGSVDFRGTQLAKCLRDGGGWYIDHSSTRDSVRLPILANVSFATLTLDRRYGLVVHARATARPGRSRALTVKSRADYWQQSKRMPQGGLVAIVTQYKHSDPQLAIGILTMMTSRFAHSSPKDGEMPTIQFGIHFIDAAVGLEAAQILQ